MAANPGPFPENIAVEIEIYETDGDHFRNLRSASAIAVNHSATALSPA